MQKKNVLTDDELEKIATQIRKSVAADRIYLFGSYRKGTADRYSDLDLCILTRDKQKRKLDQMKSIRRSLRSITSLPMDILVYDTDEFDDRSRNRSTLESQIARDGIEIG